MAAQERGSGGEPHRGPRRLTGRDRDVNQPDDVAVAQYGQGAARRSYRCADRPRLPCQDADAAACRGLEKPSAQTRTGMLTVMEVCDG
jgi:hypothetical protein